VRGRKKQKHEIKSVLHLEPIDPAADRLAIDELAEWCHQFSPTVGLEEAAAPESLLLDATGLGRLFGGEETLARRIASEFQNRGLAARVALADTPGAAWAVAHFADLKLPAGCHEGIADIGCHAHASGCHAHACVSMLENAAVILSALSVPLIVPPGQTWSALASLPPAALRLPDETCALLDDLGVRRIEQLAGLARKTLLARFGPLVLERLDQARGMAAEAIAACPPRPEWLFEQLFEHPTGRRETIEGALEYLVSRACAELARGGRGVLRLECRFQFEGRPEERFVVGFYRATASARHVGDMLRLKLEQLRFGEPVAAIGLRVLAIDRLEFRQRELFAGEQCRESPRELAALVDRLSNRLGAHAVVRPWLLASAQPEFACQYRPALLPLPSRKRVGVRGRKNKDKPKPKKIAHQQSGAGPLTPGPSPARGEGGDRPLHLEAVPRPLAVLSVVPDGPPVKFRLGESDERIARTWGPERIETGWWRGACVRRDYYQVETVRGQRYWLFRELATGRWFLHGRFT
jgi:protein ImuB